MGHCAPSPAEWHPREPAHFATDLEIAPRVSRPADWHKYADHLNSPAKICAKYRWSLRNMLGAFSVRERAKFHHSRMRPPLLMKA